MLEHPIEFAGFHFTGSNMGTLFSAKFKTLFISDLHFGKAQHFRKNGVPIALESIEDNINNLDYVLKFYQPKECIFLGDLFHSERNNEWELLISLLEKWRSQIEFTLILGNHDIIVKQTPLPEFLNASLGFLWNETIQLTHEPEDLPNQWQICGHLHAGYSLSGKGRQVAMIKCFYLHNKMLIMPAFGNLTGKVALNKQLPGGSAIGYTKDSIFEIKEADTKR